MKLIPLTQGQFAQVDDEDFEFLNQFKWCAIKIGHTWYAKKGVYIKETQETKTAWMHRYVLEITDRNIKVDHIDHDGLNNQRNNLRVATQSQNIAHMVNRCKGKSKYLGVTWDKRRKLWCAEITKNYKKTHLGSFHNETDAALAYNQKALELHGEFASLNKVA